VTWCIIFSYKDPETKSTKNTYVKTHATSFKEALFLAQFLHDRPITVEELTTKVFQKM
jgi:hypothetical protein